MRKGERKEVLLLVCQLLQLTHKVLNGLVHAADELYYRERSKERKGKQRAKRVGLSLSLAQ